MFYCDITARELIDDICGEADIAIPIPNRSYVQWLNSAEQLIYSEIIKEVHYAECTIPGYQEFYGPIKLSEFSNGSDTERDNIAPIRSTDISGVYIFGSSNGENPQSETPGRGTELIPASNANAEFFDNSYHFLNNGICIHSSELDNVDKAVVTVYYNVRPKLKTIDESGNVSEDKICIPVEWLELIQAYIQAHAYSAANEFTLANNRFGIYNNLLENFKQYIELRKIGGIGL